MYFPQTREATAQDLELAAALGKSAAIIISRHQDAEKLAETRAALEAADQQKDEFLAMLAHELRNPLAPIGNASEILSRMVSEDVGARAATAMIKRQTAQLSRLVDDLLDVSRITQGHIHLRRRPLELASVITQAVETVEPQLREKRHRISVATSGSLPLYVNGDSARLVQCVGNLLTNAIKYTEPDGDIRVSVRSEESSVVIEISDTGAGIAPGLLPRIFDLFVQSDRTLDRAQGGLGIGLAVVKRLVEMHGGQVIARSAGEGTGSTFEIRLPRIPRSPAPRAEPEPFKAPPRRVLIVDDNRDAANSLALLLDFQGHETEVAYSGREALDRIERYGPEVALLDIGLPEMDGYELARRLRAMPALTDLRLIALTGYGQAEDRQRAQAAGFDDHLVKPVDLPALERALAGSSAAGGPTQNNGQQMREGLTTR
jgi:signal transduction histidine kinase/ActR/RegA family two-component response regulator